MSRKSPPRPPLSDLTDRLGVEVEHELLVRSLTHRSYAYENGGLPTNERLEFLGDSVLGLVVTDTLYRTHPDLPEGQLAKLRAAVVNARALAGIGRELRLGEHLLLGRGEETTGGRDKASIVADTVEAVIGAVYLDRGLDEATALVHRLFDPLIDEAAALGAGLDWKTSLQELCAAEGVGVPEYVVEESGPDHEKSFTARVRVGGDLFGDGHGRSKKEAEQEAAATAYAELLEQSRARAALAAGDRRRGACGRLMPELPEVEVVRRGLDRWVTGRTVRDAEVLHPRAARRHARGCGRPREPRSPGATIAAASRRGKYLWLAARRTRPRARRAPGHERAAARPARRRAGRDAPAGAAALHRRRSRAALRRPAHVRRAGPRAARARRRRRPRAGVASRTSPATRSTRSSTSARGCGGCGAGAPGSSARCSTRRSPRGIGNIYADEALWRARLHWAMPDRRAGAGARPRGCSATPAT